MVIKDFLEFHQRDTLAAPYSNARTIERIRSAGLNRYIAVDSAIQPGTQLWGWNRVCYMNPCPCICQFTPAQRLSAGQQGQFPICPVSPSEVPPSSPETPPSVSCSPRTYVCEPLRLASRSLSAVLVN